MRTILLSLSTLILCQCTPTATLIVATYPPFATVTDTRGNTLGSSPLEIEYQTSDLEESQKQDGCYPVPGVTLNWSNGAIAEVPEVGLCGRSSGRFLLTVQRPQGQSVQALGRQSAAQYERNRSRYTFSSIDRFRHGYDRRSPDASTWYDQIDNVQSRSDRAERWESRSSDPDVPVNIPDWQAARD